MQRHPWKKPPYFLVLDVETVGLYGEPFAFAAVILDSATWETVVETFAVCPFGKANGPPDDRKWAEEHIAPPVFQSQHEPRKVVESPDHLRDYFADLWLHWSAKGAIIVADGLHPVEAEFLSGMWVERKISGKPEVPSPYPVLDLPSMYAGAGWDPSTTYDRLESELPKHNPLADARQSARLLIEETQVTFGEVDFDRSRPDAGPMMLDESQEGYIEHGALVVPGSEEGVRYCGECDRPWSEHPRIGCTARMDVAPATEGT